MVKLLKSEGDNSRMGTPPPLMDHETSAAVTTRPDTNYTPTTHTRSLSLGAKTDHFTTGTSVGSPTAVQRRMTTQSNTLANRGPAKGKRKAVLRRTSKGNFESIIENVDERGDRILEEFAAVQNKSTAGSGSTPEEVKHRWAAKFSPEHMYCTMKGYEDILDDLDASKSIKDKRPFSPDRENMVIASMKHHSDAAFCAQVNEKQMEHMSTKFTAAMRLHDVRKHQQGLPHTSKQPIMQNDPADVYQAWSHAWPEDFNFRMKTYRETTSVIDEIREGEWTK